MYKIVKVIKLSKKIASKDSAIIFMIIIIYFFNYDDDDDDDVTDWLPVWMVDCLLDRLFHWLTD